MSHSSKWRKRLKYAIAAPVLKTYLWGLRKTSTIQVHGEHHLTALSGSRPFIPCYWHQQNLGCAIFLLSVRTPNFNPGFLVSPSRDGEIPARIFRDWGVQVIRGSSSRTGAQAIRDLYLAVSRDNISPANTPDGPRGPIFEFKPGPLMLAQMTGAPILPMASAARRCKQLNSWDRFILPGWFNTLVVAVGEPVFVQKGLSMGELEPQRRQLETTLRTLTDQAKQLVMSIS
ncbi:MAG TPA: lysophospholipid acyltransferase family protein [Gammaproteobacteria bacterium]